MTDDKKTHVRGNGISYAIIVNTADEGIGVTMFGPGCNLHARFTTGQAREIIAAIQLAIGETT